MYVDFSETDVDIGGVRLATQKLSYFLIQINIDVTSLTKVSSIFIHVFYDVSPPHTNAPLSPVFTSL